MENIKSSAELNQEIVRKYILGTHGSLPNIDNEQMGQLLSDDFKFSNEEQTHNRSTLLEIVFPGWASILNGCTTVRIHSVCSNLDSNVVLAHWETDYDCCDGATWYGTDVDISGKQVRGFQVFASFTVIDNKITKIVQRSDTVVKHLGIEKEVQAFRNRNV